MSTTLCGGWVAGVTLTGWHVEGGQQRAAGVGCDVGGSPRWQQPASGSARMRTRVTAGVKGPQKLMRSEVLWSHACRRCLFLRRSQRHGWAGGYVLLISRQSRAHSIITAATAPLGHTIPPLPPPNSPVWPVTASCPGKKNLPIFSWGIDHERDSLRQDLQAMCQQVA